MAKTLLLTFACFTGVSLTLAGGGTSLVTMVINYYVLLLYHWLPDCKEKLVQNAYMCRHIQVVVCDYQSP